jgi:hypothetical protein
LKFVFLGTPPRPARAASLYFPFFSGKKSWISLAELCTIQSMETKKELLQKPTEELVKIILDLRHIILNLQEEVRCLKDGLAKAKKSVPGRK